MAARFHSETHRREEVTFLKLGGVIDEDNELSVLAEQMGPGTLVIDLSEIERINSCGVRDWVNWLGKVEKGGGKVVMVECSPAIVAQVNLVNNFTGHGVVKSFYAPYFCPSCEREKVLLIETRDAAGAAPFHAPTCRCDECDGPMDFDDMEDSYFAFLANSAKIVTDARVDEVITEFTPSEGGGPKLRARTSPSLTPAGLGPGAPASSLPSVPSLPPLPALRRGAEAQYSAVTTGKHLLPSGLTPAPPPSPSAAALPVTLPSTLAATNGATAAAGGVATPSLPRLTPAFPLSTVGAGPPLSEPQQGNGWMAVVAVLVLAALGLVAYLVLGGPNATATTPRPAGPPASTPTPR